MSQSDSPPASLLEVPADAAQISEAHRIAVPAPRYRVLTQRASAPSAAEESSRGSDLASGFYYIPNFVTLDEEAYLIQHILHAPQPKWKVLQARRLQYWGGQLTGKGKNVLLPDPQGLPSFLARYPNLVERLAHSGAFQGSHHGRPNHCLINEYQPGQGIMPHDDGPAYEPVTATISLGSHALLDIYEWIDDASLSAAGATPAPTADPTLSPGAEPRKARGARAPEPTFTLLQEPRSLLVTRGDAYHDWLHGIADRALDPPECLARVANAAQLHDTKLRQCVQQAQQAHPTLVPDVSESTESSTSTEKFPATSAPDPSAQGSDPVALPRDTRYSLTFRDVARVSNALGGLAARKLGIA